MIAAIFTTATALSFFVVLVTLLACSFAVILICHNAPIIEEPMDAEEERLHRIFTQAMHHRDHLDACFLEACEIHGLAANSCSRDQMADVIYGGLSYSEAMQRIAMIEQWEREEG